MLYKGGDYLPRKKNPWTKRTCVKYAGEETLRILCKGSDCMCFVRVPIREGKVGGTESHTWRGCMYILGALAECAESLGIPIDEVLCANR